MQNDYIEKYFVEKDLNLIIATLEGAKAYSDADS